MSVKDATIIVPTLNVPTLNVPTLNVPIQDLESEVNLLSYIIYKGKLPIAISKMINASDFNDPVNSFLFSVIQRMTKINYLVSRESIEKYIKDSSLEFSEEAGERLISLEKDIKNNKDPVFSVQRIVGANLARKVEVAFTQMFSSRGNIVDILNNLKNISDDISDTIKKTGAPTYTVSTYQEDNKELTDTIVRNAGKDPKDLRIPEDAISTEYQNLDNITKGLRKGEVFVIAGESFSGKTTLAINIGTRIALSNKKVLFFSLEMSRRSVRNMQASICTNLPPSYYMMGSGFTSEELKTADSYFMSVARNRNFFNVIGDRLMNINEIEYALAREVKLNSPDVVMIDNIQIIGHPQMGKNTTMALTEISANIRAWSERYDVAIILLSQLNKTVHHEEENKPRLKNIMGGNAIVQDADRIALIHRPGNVPDSNEDPRLMNLYIEKNRGLDKGKVELVFSDHQSSSIIEKEITWNI